MGTTSITGICGTVVVALLLVWGLNWYCGTQNPTGWIGTQVCPAVGPFYNLAGVVARWFAGLFGGGGEPAPAPGLQGAVNRSPADQTSSVRLIGSATGGCRAVRL